MVIEIAREISSNAMCNETVVDLAIAFQKTSHDNMKDAGMVSLS